MKVLDEISSMIPLSLKSYDLHPRYNIIKLDSKSMYFLMEKFRNFILSCVIKQYLLDFLYIMVIMHLCEWVIHCGILQYVQNGLRHIFRIIICIIIYYYAIICVFISQKIICSIDKLYIDLTNDFYVGYRNKNIDTDVYVAVVLFIVPGPIATVIKLVKIIFKLSQVRSIDFTFRLFRLIIIYNSFIELERSCGEVTCDFRIILLNNLPVYTFMEVVVFMEMLHRIAMEERKNNEFFKNHKPLFTPAKLRGDQIQLYNPQCDFEATMLLGMMPTPYDDDSDNEKESNAFTPIDNNANNNSNHLVNSFVNTFGTKMQNSFHNSNASNKNLANMVISPPFTPINENEPMEKIKNNNNNHYIICFIDKLYIDRPMIFMLIIEIKGLI